MQKNIFKKSLKFLGSAFFASYIALSPVYAKEHNFNKDKFSFQVVLGGLSSSVYKIGPENPDIRYIQTNLRIGWVLDKPTFPRGNLEALVEVSGSNIYKGPGNYLIGVASFLRYNGVQPGKLIPYTQIGLGFVYTDIHKDYSQDTIGQAMNFTLQASVGFRYLINEKWSTDIEFKVYHASCGNFILNNNNRNDGLNSLGASIGITYSF